MKRILREPLVHFLLLGAALFAAYSLFSNRTGEGPGKIVITRGQIDTLAEAFTRTRQRPPNREELDRLIRDRVREEIYCREALALGLDKDDPIIRRRLRQKMEFISDDIAAQAEPTDAELTQYLQAHAGEFRVEQQFAFRQLFLNPEKRGEHLARDVAQLLAKLNQAGNKADLSGLGDSSPLGRRFENVSIGEIGKQFGDTFAAELARLPVGKWQGPVESGFGVHLVFISERTEGRLPPLAEVRDAVSREWTDTRRLEVNEKFYQDLARHYSVTIENAPPARAKKEDQAK